MAARKKKARARRPSRSEVNREVDQRYVRQDLAGILGAALCFSASTREQAQLVHNWFVSTLDSDDVGGKVGLDQPYVKEVVAAAHNVLELADSDAYTDTIFAHSCSHFVQQYDARPLSFVLGAAMIAMWRSPVLLAIVSDPTNIQFAWAPRSTPRPFLQLMPSFLVGNDGNVFTGRIQFEAIANDWRESRHLAELSEKAFPLVLSHENREVHVTLCSQGEHMDDTWSKWRLSRTFFSLDVVASWGLRARPA